MPIGVHVNTKFDVAFLAFCHGRLGIHRIDALLEVRHGLCYPERDVVGKHLSCHAGESGGKNASGSKAVRVVSPPAG
jgi:hypothetical protein